MYFMYSRRNKYLYIILHVWYMDFKSIQFVSFHTERSLLMWDFITWVRPTFVRHLATFTITIAAVRRKAVSWLL